MRSAIRYAARWFAFGAGVAAGGYAARTAVVWSRFDHQSPPIGSYDRDALLDRFMPVWNIVERHQIHVDAPPGVALRAAQESDILHPPISRAIFKLRELLTGAEPDERMKPEGLLAAMQSIGWRVLVEAPGREVVVGAVTKPWEANPVFRGLDPDDFESFNEPDYVKIAWTLRADPDGPGGSIFRTETRAVATDIDAALKFRRYSALLSPGIILIRYALLNLLEKAAERHARGIVPGL